MNCLVEIIDYVKDIKICEITLSKNYIYDIKETCN